MKKLIIFVLTICTITFNSCREFEDITFSGIEDVKVISLNQKGVEAIIIAKIKNPNKVGFTIYKSDMNVNLGGLDAGKASLTNKVKIKANSEEAYAFNIKSDFSNLGLMDIPKVIGMAMSKKLDVGIKGTLKVGKLFIKKAVPVDIKKNVPLSGI